MERSIKVTPRTEEFLKALIKVGFDKTIEEILEKFVNERMFLLGDVKHSLIAGCILLGYDKSWVVRNLPGNKSSISTAYENVRKDWKLYSSEPMPNQSEK